MAGGADNMNQARVDMIADTVDDLMAGVVKFMTEKDETRKVSTFYSYILNKKDRWDNGKKRLPTNAFSDVDIHDEQLSYHSKCK